MFSLNRLVSPCPRLPGLVGSCRPSDWQWKWGKLMTDSLGSLLIIIFFFYWAAGFLFGDLGVLLFGLAHALFFAVLLWLFRSKLTLWRGLGLLLLAYLFCGLGLFIFISLLSVLGLPGWWFGLLVNRQDKWRAWAVFKWCFVNIALKLMNCWIA